MPSLSGIKIKCYTKQHYRKKCIKMYAMHFM